MRISDWSSDVCSSDLWRSAGRTFPVIVVSARGDWTEKVEGIEAGADDYLAKPFQMGELVARVRRLVRRGAGNLPPVTDTGRLRLDTVRMSAPFHAPPPRISPLQFPPPDHLPHHPGRALPPRPPAAHLYHEIRRTHVCPPTPHPPQ